MFIAVIMEMQSRSVLELDALSTGRIDHPAPVGAPLLLILLLGESFSLGDDQIGMCPVGVIVRNIRVTGKAWIDKGVALYALESVFDMVLLLQWRLGGRRAIEFALISYSWGGRGALNGCCGCGRALMRVCSLLFIFAF